MIVDTSAVAQGALTDANCRGSAEVLKWLHHKQGVLAYGGTKHLKEISHSSDQFRRLLRVLDRIGLARRLAPEDVDEEEAQLIKSGACVSDDEHIVALASIAKCRLLWAIDGRLRVDFKNRDLINNPQGQLFNSITTTQFHLKLLRPAGRKR